MYFSLRKPDGAHILADAHSVPTVDNGFIYLGMPIFQLSFVGDYFNFKLSKFEKAFYILRGLVFKAELLSPWSIGFVSKQYRQSICR